jgi:hypothetical protein
MRGMRKGYKILVGKSEGNRSLERPNNNVWGGGRILKLKLLYEGVD